VSGGETCAARPRRDGQRGAAGAGWGFAAPADGLQALLDALPVGVFTVDAAGSIVRCNDEAARFSGLDARSVRGRACAQVFSCSLCGPVCLAQQARRAGRCDRPLPHDVRDARGTVRSIAASSRALPDGEVAIVLRDVTATERLRRDLETAFCAPSSPASSPVPPRAAQDAETLAALHRAAGNVTIAARLLGIHRTTLWRRMCARGLCRDRFRPGPPAS
jgi:PAS domain S-box-containing protein